MMAAVRSGWLPREPLYINIECSSWRAGAALGAGPVIRVGDRISVFDPSLTAGLVAIAEGEADGTGGSRLPHQRKLMDGGACEATVLALAGFQVGAVALPLDHYHNWGRKRLRPETIDIDDAVALVNLLIRVAVCREGVAGSGEGAQRNHERRLESRYQGQRPRLEEARSPRSLGGILK